MLRDWKAPAAMKRIWVVCHHAVARLTVVPSTIGRMSRWTPSRETSGAAARSRPAFYRFIEEDDSGGFDPVEGGAGDGVHIDEPFFLLLHQILQGLIDAHAAAFGAPLKRFPSIFFHSDAHLLEPWGPATSMVGKTFLANFEFDDTVIEFAGAQLRAQLFACALELIIASGTPALGLERRRRGVVLGGEGLAPVSPSSKSK